jgi:hypothetical protein
MRISDSMAKKQSTTLRYNEWLQQSAIRIGRVLFVLTLVYVVMIILYDAFALVTPDMLLVRWVSAAGLAVGSALLWYSARKKQAAASYYARLLYGYVLLLVLFASVNVYLGRGMASKSVLLFVIPIIVSGLLLRRAAIYMTTVIATAAYVLTSMTYAINNPSEGYKIELYGEVGFYSGVLFIVAALVWDVVRSKNADDS